MPLITRDRRIVLKTLTGPRAGLRAIQGTVSQLLTDTGLTELPQRVESVDFITHDSAAQLIAQHNTYVLYCEDAPPVPPPPDLETPYAVL